MPKVILRPEITLDDAVLKVLKTYYNGCNFSVVFDCAKGECYLQPGCYLLVNLMSTDEKMLYDWLDGEKKKLLLIEPETKRELLKREPCKICGSPFFILNDGR